MANKKTFTYFYCAVCGKGVTNKHKKHFTKAIYGEVSKTLNISFVCPYCSAFTDVSVLQDDEWSNSFLDWLELYSVDRMTLPNPVKKK